MLAGVMYVNKTLIHVNVMCINNRLIHVRLMHVVHDVKNLQICSHTFRLYLYNYINYFSQLFSRFGVFINLCECT